MEEQGSVGVVPGVKVPVGAIYLALLQPNCPDVVRAGSDPPPLFFFTLQALFALSGNSSVDPQHSMCPLHQTSF